MQQRYSLPLWRLQISKRTPRDLLSKTNFYDFDVDFGFDVTQEKKR